MDHADHWKKCNSCKKPITFGALYWICNVSTCNRKRTGLAFCAVSCWDAHLPFMNHREAWAEERKAPSAEEWAKIISGETEPVRRKTADKTAAKTPASDPIKTPSEPRVILRKGR